MRGRGDVPRVTANLLKTPIAPAVPDRPDCAVSFVRPGSGALDWLADTLAALRRADPLRPVTVIVPNYNAGLFLRRRLAERGGWANLRTLRLSELVRRIAAAQAAGQPTLSGLQRQSAIRRAAEQVGGPLAATAQHRSLLAALDDLF